MDALQAQLEERKKNMSRKNAETTTETEQKVSESVENILRSIEQRKSRLRDLQNNITQLHKEYEAEAVLLAKEKEFLRRFRETQEPTDNVDEQMNDNIDTNLNYTDTANRTRMSVDANDDRTNTEVAGSTNEQVEAEQQRVEEERKKQEQHDEELALHLQRQYDHENNETDENTSQPHRQQQQYQPQQQFQEYQQQQHQQHQQHQQQQQQQQEQRHRQGSQPQNRSGQTSYSFSFGSDPSNMMTVSNSSNNDNLDNENSDPYSLLSQFHGFDNSDNNTPFMASSFFSSPFGSSRPLQFTRRSSSSGNRNNRNVDPLEQMFGMPLLRMGGMGMPFIDLDSLDHDQLLQLFPDVPRGANEEVIQSLPENKFEPQQKQNKNGDDKKEKNNDEQCCICMEEFKKGDPIRRLPCMHIFHKQEIDTWLRRNHICPICRLPVDEQPQHHPQ